MVTPIEAEGNEYYQGRYKEGMIKGPSHEAGGVNMLAVEGDFIYPRKYAKQGQAIRSEILRIENKMKRLENKLAKASNPTLAKNTYERTFNKVKDELQELYQTEEALKQQIVAEKEAKEAAKLGVQQPEMQEQLPEEAMYDLGGFINPPYSRNYKPFDLRDLSTLSDETRSKISSDLWNSQYWPINKDRPNSPVTNPRGFFPQFESRTKPLSQQEFYDALYDRNELMQFGQNSRRPMSINSETPPTKAQPIEDMYSFLSAPKKPEPTNPNFGKTDASADYINNNINSFSIPSTPSNIDVPKLIANPSLLPRKKRALPIPSKLESDSRFLQEDLRRELNNPDRPYVDRPIPSKFESDKKFKTDAINRILRDTPRIEEFNSQPIKSFNNPTLAPKPSELINKKFKKYSGTQQPESQINPPSFQVGDIGVALNSLIPAAYNLYQSMQPTAQYNFGRVRPVDYIPLSPEQALRDQRIATSTAANMNTRMPAGMRSGMLANLQAGALKGMQDTRFAYDQQNVQNRNQVNQMNAQIQGQNIALSMQERQLADAANAARQQFGSTGFSQLGNVFGNVGSAMNKRQEGIDLATISNMMQSYFDVEIGPDGKGKLVFKKAPVTTTK
jgi:hypothetical protein